MTTPPRDHAATRPRDHDPTLQSNHPQLEAVVRVQRPYKEQAVGLLGSRAHAVGADDPGSDTVDVSFTVTNTEAFLYRLFELSDRAILVGPEADLSDESLIWIEPVGEQDGDDDLVFLDDERIDTIGTEMFDASVLG